MRFGKALTTAGLISAMVALLFVSAAGGTTRSTPATASGAVVTWAEAPSAVPNYIFPLSPPQYSSVTNTSQFEYLMYRPLYLYGGNDNNLSIKVNYGVSLAGAPVFNKNDTAATITLKSYKWSNGESVDARDVLFWMNMLRAEKTNWYDYVPTLFPDNITNVTISGQKVVFTFNRSYNPNWMLYNEFAQITPMPIAWDIAKTGAAPGSGACSSGAYTAASTAKACAAVFKYLNAQAASLSTYSTNPLWGIVDGPFSVASSLGGSFNSSGDVTLVPNPSYSGHKASIAKFEEVPFTTDNAEYNALVGGKIDVGYLPSQDLTAGTSNPLKAGPNNPRLAGKFTLSPWVLFGYNYAVLKFESNGEHGVLGKIFGQLYVRQAMQHLIDQSLIINKLLKGYGVPTYGPVPVLPKNSDTDAYETSNPYPYSISDAKQLLSSHGWSVVPGGTDVCERAGTAANECGAGIPKGSKLAFTFSYATGVNWIDQTAAIEQSAWNSVGIHTTLDAGTFDAVVGDYAPSCASEKTCNGQFGWWGGGWVYAPDYYPSGETIYQTGAGSNSANYSSPTADSLIKATYETTANLDAYQNYIAKQIPTIWQPNGDYSLVEVKDGLKGVLPQNVYSILFPEYWHF